MDEASKVHYYELNGEECLPAAELSELVDPAQPEIGMIPCLA